MYGRDAVPLSRAWAANGGLWIDFVDGYRLFVATLPRM